MKRIAIACIVASLPVSAMAQVPVIDAKNFAVAQETAKTTKDILDNNKEILKTVEDTLQAVTGDRGSESGQLSKVAIGQGFSVGQMPSFGSLMQGGVPNFGSMSGDIAGVATTMINALKLVKSLTGKKGSEFSGDKSYEEMVSTVMGVAALVNGAQGASTQRKAALESASNQIGTAKDVKGSVDQNSQLQVQLGLTTNELIGVMTGAVQSLQTQNQKRITDISNTSRALRYE